MRHVAPPLGDRRVRVGLVTALVAALNFSLTWTAGPAWAAGIALVGSGTEQTASAALSITPTINATTQGDLVVASVTVRANCVTISAPSGWTKAKSACSASGTTGIWYLPNAASLTSATFSWSTSATATAQLSEWSGAATSSPVDQTGSVTVSTAATSATVSTSSTVKITGELAISSFVTGSTGMTSLTAGSGWTHLVADTTNGVASDQRLPVPAGSLSEKETSSSSVTWAGVIVTFRTAICNGGSLTLNPPSSVSFPGTALNGTNKVSTTTAVGVADDETGSGSGWQIDGTSTTLNSGTHTLPSTATNVTGASVTAGTNNCSLPTNSVTYPVTLPAGTTPPTAVKLFDASALTGEGPANATLDLSLSVPASSFTGTYSSTWTLTIASGP